jgi:predicted transcriptional regulator
MSTTALEADEKKKDQQNSVSFFYQLQSLDFSVFQGFLV